VVRKNSILGLESGQLPSELADILTARAEATLIDLLVDEVLERIR
jgi:hypothetical protein